MIGYVEFPAWLRPEIIPSLPIRWYGLMYLVAFGLTYFLFRYLAAKHRDLNLEKDTVLNLFFWGIIGILIGGRIFSVLIYDSTGFYMRHPLQIFFPFQRINGALKFIGLQGMSYHGGLIGAVSAIIIYCRVKKIPVLKVTDLVAVSAPLGYTFGRLGNFINGELYGRVTSWNWGVIFPNATKYSADQQWVQALSQSAGLPIVETSSMVNLPRFPSQLFEAFFEGVFLWFLLWFIFCKWRPFTGFLTVIYAIGYGVVRFGVEYIREPDSGIGFPVSFVSVPNPTLFSLWNFTMGQILSFAMVVCGMIALIFLARTNSEQNKEHKTSRNHHSQRPISLRRLRKKLR